MKLEIMPKNSNQPNIQKSLAELLKDGRAEKNISIDELSQLSGISAQHLKHLEAGNYGAMPAAIYTEHFLEKCAGHLSIPKDTLISAYRKETNTDDAVKNILAKQKPPIFKHSLLVTPKFVMVAVMFILVISTGGYLWYQLSHLLGAPYLIVESPKGDIIVNEESIMIGGYTQADGHIFLNGREIVNSNGHFEERLVLQSGMNIAEIKSINRFEKEAVIVRRIIKN